MRSHKLYLKMDKIMSSGIKLVIKIPFVYTCLMVVDSYARNMPLSNVTINS